MTKITFENISAEDVAKQFFWLAWQASGRPFGMGVLQDFPEATIEDVWKNILSSGDYPVPTTPTEPGELYADYVFGRMLKIGLILNTEENSIVYDDNRIIDYDYQAWSTRYPSIKALIEASIEVVEKEKA